MIELVATAHHEHFDETGVRVRHAPGDRYILRDGNGLTAAALAARFVALGVAKPADAKPKPKASK